jgi:hypothetical protein
MMFLVPPILVQWSYKLCYHGVTVIFLWCYTGVSVPGGRGRVGLGTSPGTVGASTVQSTGCTTVVVLESGSYGERVTVMVLQLCYNGVTAVLQ